MRLKINSNVDIGLFIFRYQNEVFTGMDP